MAHDIRDKRLQTSLAAPRTGVLTTLAAAAMILIGIALALQGLNSVIVGEAYVVESGTLYRSDVAAVGWMQLICAVALLVAGVTGWRSRSRVDTLLHHPHGPPLRDAGE